MDDETTLNVGVISGGSVRNAVPEHASFEGEFRSRNIESLEMIKLDINNILEEARSKYPDAVIDETLNVEFDMYNLSDKDPMMALASDVITKMGMTPVIGPSGGGTDANIFNKKGVSCVCVGMGTRDMHTVREYVPILDLYHAALFCHSLLVYEK
jgi:tripeptide aminopeptidase